VLAHRLNPNVIVGRSQNRKLSAFRSGHLFRFVLRLLGRNSGTKPAYGAYGYAHAVRGVIAESIRKPDVGRGNHLSVWRKVQVEVRLENADDDQTRRLRAGNLHRASNHRGISAIPALKVLIAQDRLHRQPWWRRSLLRARRRSGRIWDRIVIIKISAVGDAATEQSECVGRHDRSIRLLSRAVLALQRERKSEDPGNVFEDGLGAFAQIDEVGVRKREIADIALAHIGARNHQAVGMVVRQWP
jgi:hypothetical protein